jgi:hypothetical protein
MMVTRGLLSAAFIEDLHMVDFTRPLFSDARCSLLEFAPAITVADVKAADNLAQVLEAGFIRELATATSAAGKEFLANLNDRSGDANAAKVTKFVDACNKRAASEPKVFMTEIVKMAELMRQETETQLEIIESFLREDVWPSIPGMARDFSRWNPATCTLE